MIIEDAQEHVSYDRRTILLHWIVAGMIAFMWLLAQLNMRLPKGPLRLNLWSIHVLVGFCLMALVVARVVWRLTHGDRLPPAERGIRNDVAVAVHYLLYVLMIAVVVFGLAHVSGFPLFGVLKFPSLWDKSFNDEIGEWHGLAANIIAGVAVVHALAALYHHYIVKDHVLVRMRLGIARRG